MYIPSKTYWQKIINIGLWALYIGHRSLGDQRLAGSLKSKGKAASVWDPCALIDLSAISPSRWKNVAFIERSLRDHWEIGEIIECSLRDRFPWRSLRDCFGLSQNLEETMATMEITGQSLTDQWKILAIARRSLKDRWEIQPIIHHQGSLNWKQGTLQMWKLVGFFIPMLPTASVIMS